MTSVDDAKRHLVYNARILQSGMSGQMDLTWMLFNTDTGYIISVGTENPPTDCVPESRRTDFGGFRILPGLHDSHIHIGLLGRSLNSVDLRNCKSIEDLQERLRQFVDSRNSLKWIVGRGWEQDLLGRYPNKHDLDAVCKDKPVYLVRVCGHIAVANSLALQLAGKNRLTYCYVLSCC
jgi:predicted amidohydrolase YtcJ